MKRTWKQCFMLTGVIVASLWILVHRAPAQNAGPGVAVEPFPATFADPAVPLLQLPTNFRARRTNSDITATKGHPVEVFNVQGAGCVRHLWFVFGQQYDLAGMDIEILVDDTAEPQVRMPFRSFFGVLLGFPDYHIDSAGLATFPNFTVKNNANISQKASPGWNSYLPIPFSKSCRITIYSENERRGAGTVDWQQYRGPVELTPLRFHAQRNIALPAPPAAPFPIATTEGTGFLAGYIMGWRQQDHSDMVFHNSGVRLLIDGQTDPHMICGWNVEDDFGFSWGFNDYQTRWAGCPYQVNRSPNDQDGVYYRFFGPDPILFRSSLLFTSNSRHDDYEAVSYFYKVPGSRAPQVTSPGEWQAIGLFRDGHQFDVFQAPADDLVKQLSAASLPDKLGYGGTDYEVRTFKSQYGWVRLDNTYVQRPGVPMDAHSAYLRSTLQSETDRTASLRLGLDNWAIIYLNGQKIATLDHAAEFKTASIPITLKKGANPLVIKTNNQKNRDALIWAINCVVE